MSSTGTELSTSFSTSLWKIYQLHPAHFSKKIHQYFTCPVMRLIRSWQLVVGQITSDDNSRIADYSEDIAQWLKLKYYV